MARCVEKWQDLKPKPSIQHKIVKGMGHHGAPIFEYFLELMQSNVERFSACKASLDAVLLILLGSRSASGCTH